MSNLRTLTVHALSWSFASKFTSQAISILFGIILARLLIPEDFGLVAMALVMTRFAGLFADIGFGSALIQKKDVNEGHFSSVFWLNNITGVALSITLVLLSPFIAAFFNRPELEPITMALSITFIFNALALVPRSWLSKKLAFRELGTIDLVSMILSGGLAIVMAVEGYGFWSLVVQQVVERVLSTFLVWMVVDWRPRKGLNILAIRELFSFSASVFSTRSLQFISLNIGNLLLGKFLSAQAAGLFDKAQSMMLSPLQNISHVIGNVMFPSLSLIQAETDRVKSTYIRLINTVSLFSFPMMVGMFVVADSFVLGVLGPNWSDVIQLFRILCIAGLLTSIASVTGAVYLSQGRADLQLKVNLITQPIGIILVVVGLQWGVVGVTMGFAIGHVVSAGITLHVAGKLIGMSLIQIVRSLLYTLFLSLVMGALVWVCSVIFEDFGPLVMFFGQTLLGICIYSILIIIGKPAAFKDIQAVLFEEYLKKS
jgi:PST family polysaccharide transporter